MEYLPPLLPPLPLSSPPLPSFLFSLRGLKTAPLQPAVAYKSAKRSPSLPSSTEEVTIWLRPEQLHLHSLPHPPRMGRARIIFSRNSSIPPFRFSVPKEDTKSKSCDLASDIVRPLSSVLCYYCRNDTGQSARSTS